MEPNQPQFESNYPREGYQSGLPIRPPGVYFDSLSTAFQILRSGMPVFVLGSLLTLFLSMGFTLAQIPLGIPQVTGFNEMFGTALAISVLTSVFSTTMVMTMSVGMGEVTRSILLGKPAEVSQLFVGFRRIGRIAIPIAVVSVVSGALTAILTAATSDLGTYFTVFLGIAAVWAIVAIFVYGPMYMIPFSLFYGKGTLLADTLAPFKRMKIQCVLFSVLYMLASIISGLGILACGVGLLFTYAIAPIVMALHHVYFFPETMEQPGMPPAAG